MEELQSQQDELLRQLKSASANFKKTPKARLNKTYVDVKLKLLEGLWEGFFQNHMRLVQKALEYVHEKLNDVYLQQRNDFVKDHRTNTSAVTKSMQLQQFAMPAHTLFVPPAPMYSNVPFNVPLQRPLTQMQP